MGDEKNPASLKRSVKRGILRGTQHPAAIDAESWHCRRAHAANTTRGLETVDQRRGVDQIAVKTGIPGSVKLWLVGRVNPTSVGWICTEQYPKLVGHRIKASWTVAWRVERRRAVMRSRVRGGRETPPSADAPGCGRGP